VRSIEEELEKAFYQMKCISEYNYGDLKKISWTRATRTDKSVHAL
jgi:tRNA pseudouridine38-40 synthase